MEIITIIGLLLFLGYREYQTAKERKDLIKAIMSKNLTEYSINDKMVVKEKEIKQPDFIPAETLDDKQFDQMIKQQIQMPAVPKTNIKQRVAEKLFKKNAK
jgi:hypothetical protein